MHQTATITPTVREDVDKSITALEISVFIGCTPASGQLECINTTETNLGTSIAIVVILSQLNLMNIDAVVVHLAITTWLDILMIAKWRPNRQPHTSIKIKQSVALADLNFHALPYVSALSDLL